MAQAKVQQKAPLWFTLLFFGGICMLFYWMCGGSSNKKAPDNDHHIAAEVVIQKYVKHQLTYPEEADFEIMGTVSQLIDTAKNIYGVVGLVNTKNGFGVKSKIRYSAAIRYIKGDELEDQSWEILKCDLDKNY